MNHWTRNVFSFFFKTNKCMVQFNIVNDKTICFAILIIYLTQKRREILIFIHFYIYYQYCFKISVLTKVV